jgi:MFS family permease
METKKTIRKYSSRLQATIASFSAAYWKFYAAAFCMDLGFGLFFFLFNLYLTDLYFDERAIGHIVACFTLGNVAGTLPAMLLARRKGLGPLLLVTFLCAPIVCAMRVIFLSWPAQLSLAFASGVAMCSWPICFSPMIAAVTDEENRSLGFSMAFATGIGLGSLAGVAGGYIPEALRVSGLHLPLVSGIRAVLLMSCAITSLGALPVIALRIAPRTSSAGMRLRVFHPFLFRFLPAFILWNVVTGSFPVFGAIYLQKILHIPLGRLGSVFSASQMAQFGAVLFSPVIFRWMGMAKGVAAIQTCTALFLVVIAQSRNPSFAVCFYVLYFAAQFMCGPGIYNLLMNRIPEEERSTASALQNFSGAICQAGIATLTGICIVAVGYKTVLLANAAIAACSSLLFLVLAIGEKSASRGRTSSEECNDWMPPSTSADPTNLEPIR